MAVSTKSYSLRQEKYEHLGAEDAEEHGERVDCGVADSGVVAIFVLFAGIGKGRRVGAGTCEHTDEGAVVEAHGEAADNPAEKHRDYCNHGTVGNPDITTIRNRLDEAFTRFEADAGKENRDSHFAKHQVGRGSGVGNYLKLRAEVTD